MHLHRTHTNASEYAKYGVGNIQNHTVHNIFRHRRLLSPLRLCGQVSRCCRCGEGTGKVLLPENPYTYSATEMQAIWLFLQASTRLCKIRKPSRLTCSQLSLGSRFKSAPLAHTSLAQIPRPSSLLHSDGPLASRTALRTSVVSCGGLPRSQALRTLHRNYTQRL